MSTSDNAADSPSGAADTGGWTLHALIYVLLSMGMPSLSTLAYRIYAIRRTSKNRVPETIAALNRPRVSIRLGRLGGVAVEQDTAIATTAIASPPPVRRRHKST
jgi:hypothetical protein